MHLCPTVRKTRIVLVRTISLMIVFSVSSGFVRFLLFNFQRTRPTNFWSGVLSSSLPLATAFIYYHAINFLSTPFFQSFQQILPNLRLSGVSCWRLDIYYQLSSLLSTLFFILFSLFVFLCTACYFTPFYSCFPTIKKPAQQCPLLTGKPFPSNLLQFNLLSHPHTQPIHTLADHRWW